MRVFSVVVVLMLMSPKFSLAATGASPASGSVAATASSTVTPTVTAPGHHDGAIYDEVLTMCLRSQSQTDFLIGEVKRVSQLAYETSMIGMLQMAPVIEIAKNKGLSKELSEKLKSDGFYAGIDACFPNDPYKKFIYISALIGEDLDARLAGAGVAVLIFWAPVKLIGMFGVVMTRLPGVWFHVGGYMVKALNAAMYGGTVVSLYFSLAETYKIIAASLHPERNLRQSLADDRDKATLEVIAAIENQISTQKARLSQNQISAGELQDLAAKIATNEGLLTSLRQSLHLPAEEPTYDFSYTGI
jgi:hypothetical protein